MRFSPKMDMLIKAFLVAFATKLVNSVEAGTFINAHDAIIVSLFTAVVYIMGRLEDSPRKPDDSD